MQRDLHLACWIASLEPYTRLGVTWVFDKQDSDQLWMGNHLDGTKSITLNRQTGDLEHAAILDGWLYFESAHCAHSAVIQSEKSFRR